MKPLFSSDLPFSKLLDMSTAIFTPKSVAVSVAVGGLALLAVEVQRHHLLDNAKDYVQAKVDHVINYVTHRVVKQAEAKTGLPLGKDSRHSIVQRFINFRSAKQKAHHSPLQAMLQEIAITQQSVEVLLDDKPDTPARRYHGRLSFTLIDNDPLFILKGYLIDNDDFFLNDDDPVSTDTSIWLYFRLWFLWLVAFTAAKPQNTYVSFSLDDVAGISFDFDQDNAATPPYYLIVIVRQYHD